MRETFTTPDGRRLAYERRGSGPLLVCHPGGPGGSAAEFRDFAGLDDTFELVLLCPRGSLGSDPADDYSLASYVRDVEALREHLGVEQVDLLGFSHGGCVAMAYAAAHPAHVRRLLLVDTLAVWGKEAEAAMQRGVVVRSGEPWFADAAKAIEEEQAGEFASAAELTANLRRQIPLYFHRWEGNEQTGRELAADFAEAKPCTTSTRSSSRPSTSAKSFGRSRLRRSSSWATTTSSAGRPARTRSSASCRTGSS